MHKSRQIGRQCKTHFTSRKTKKRPRLFRAVVENLLGTSVPVMEFAPYVHRVLQGIPTEHFVKHAYFRYRSPRPTQGIDPARDRCGLTWFAPILPLTSSDVMPFLAVCIAPLFAAA